MVMIEHKGIDANYSEKIVPSRGLVDVYFDSDINQFFFTIQAGEKFDDYLRFSVEVEELLARLGRAIGDE